MPNVCRECANALDNFDSTQLLAIFDFANLDGNRVKSFRALLQEIASKHLDISGADFSKWRQIDYLRGDDFERTFFTD